MSNEPLHPFRSETHYRLLRAKLVAFLDRRSCTSSEDLADEALARLINYSNACEVENVDATAYVIAKNVFHEWLRQSGRFVGLEHDPTCLRTPASERFRLIAEAVVGDLNPVDRAFLEQYFIDGKSAKDLASQLGASPVAVRGRAFRLRHRLKVAVEAMLAEGAPASAFAASRAA